MVHVVDSLRPGGAERMAVELATMLDPAGFDVSVWATRESGPLERLLGDGVPLTVLNRTGRWDVRGITGVHRLAHKERIDVVHSHGRGSAELVALSRRLGRCGFRHVFHDHFGGAEREQGVDRGLRLACRYGVDAYVGVHRRLCERAVDVLGMPPSRVHLVPNGVDIRRFAGVGHLAAPSQGRTLRLVAVAGLRPEKDHPTLLRAVAGARCRSFLELVLVGPRYAAHDGYAQACLALVGELGLAGQVTITGATDDVPAVLAGADVGVLSSTTESGPIAVLEYMAAGLPVVMTDTGEVRAAVARSGAGLVVPVGDATALGAAIDRVAEMGSEGRRAMGARGRALVAGEFDQRQVVERVVGVYRQVLAGTSAGRPARC